MNAKNASVLIKYLMAITAMFVINACGPTDSPEGRMNLKVEALRQEMDSIKQQNAAVLDSLGAIREELRQIRENRR
jgi:hypothetical protein